MQRLFAQSGQQRARARLRIREQCDIRWRTPHLHRIDVHTDALLSGRLPGPAPPRHLQARADTEHQVGLRPQAPRCRNVQPQFMRVADHAAPAAKSDDRRIQQLGQLEN